MNEDCFLELIAMWCDAEARSLFVKANRVRKRYSKTAFPGLATEFAEILEKHGRDFEIQRTHLLLRSRRAANRAQKLR